MLNLNKANQSGITLIALVITVIVILIIASISIYEGTDLIKKSKIESLMTNMIVLKSKSKVIAEEINAATWNKTEEEKKAKFTDENTYAMQETTISQEQANQLDSDIQNAEYICYSITEGTLEYMDFSGLEDGENYIVVYKKDDFTKLDIVYKEAIPYDGESFYTLSSLQAKMEE